MFKYISNKLNMFENRNRNYLKIEYFLAKIKKKEYK